jgi:hypothetical protein
MGRMLRVAVLGLAIAAVLSGLLGGAIGTREVAAAAGYAQWLGPYGNGCYYYGDAYVATAAACPRTDGGWDFYSPNGAGGWTLVASVGYASDGSMTLWYLGIEHDALYPSTAVVGPATNPTLTGNPVVDQILIGYVSATNSRTQAPECLYWTHNGNTCVYS